MSSQIKDRVPTLGRSAVSKVVLWVPDPITLAGAELVSRTFLLPNTRRWMAERVVRCAVQPLVLSPNLLPLARNFLANAGAIVLCSSQPEVELPRMVDAISSVLGEGPVSLYRLNLSSAKSMEADRGSHIVNLQPYFERGGLEGVWGYLDQHASEWPTLSTSYEDATVEAAFSSDQQKILQYDETAGGQLLRSLSIHSIYSSSENDLANTIARAGESLLFNYRPTRLEFVTLPKNRFEESADTARVDEVTLALIYNDCGIVVREGNEGALVLPPTSSVEVSRFSLAIRAESPFAPLLCRQFMVGAVNSGELFLQDDEILFREGKRMGLSTSEGDNAYLYLSTEVDLPTRLRLLAFFALKVGYPPGDFAVAHTCLDCGTQNQRMDSRRRCAKCDAPLDKDDDLTKALTQKQVIDDVRTWSEKANRKREDLTNEFEILAFLRSLCRQIGADISAAWRGDDAVIQQPGALVPVIFAEANGRRVAPPEPSDNGFTRHIYRALNGQIWWHSQRKHSVWEILTPGALEAALKAAAPTRAYEGPLESLSIDPEDPLPEDSAAEE